MQHILWNLRLLSPTVAEWTQIVTSPFSLGILAPEIDLWLNRGVQQQALADGRGMPPELALKLVSIFEAYFDWAEFRELVALFDVSLDSVGAMQAKWLSVARELMGKLEYGNTRRLLDNLLDLSDTRNNDGVAHTTWERRDFHQSMIPVIQEARELLEVSAAPSEITIPAGSVFSAKSKVRELLETATGDVFIVDPYVGVGTLDCLRDLSLPVRLLTGTHQNCVEPDFDRAVSTFTTEGHHLEVRRAPQLHDRHLIFNDRCWLVGGSLKDAGKKPFNCIEIVDKTAVVADLEKKWQAGTLYP